MSESNADQRGPDVVNEVMEAQADLQSVIGRLKLEEERSASAYASQNINQLERSLARLHALLGDLGHPMYQPHVHPDVERERVA